MTPLPVRPSPPADNRRPTTRGWEISILLPPPGEETRLKKGGWSGRMWWASVAGMMAALVAARVPELGPARDAREAPHASSESPGGVEPEGEGGSENISQRRSWWRTWFGFE